MLLEGLPEFSPELTYKFSTIPIGLFFFFWLCWVFVAVHGLSLVAVSGDFSLL